jgi:hypothetical protein
MILLAIGSAVCVMSGGPKLAFVTPSVVLALGGLAILGVRWTVNVDRTRGRITHTVGFVVPMVAIWSAQLGDADTVVLRLQGGRGPRFRVALTSRAGEVALRDTGSFATAYQAAMGIAESLGVGLIDKVAATGAREAQHLRETLRDRLLRTGAMTVSGSRGATRLSVTRSANALIVALPRPGLVAQLSVALLYCVLGAMMQLPVVILAAGLAHPSVAHDPVLRAISFSLSALGLLLALSVVAIELRRVESETLLEISPAGLRLRFRRPLGGGTRWLPAPALLAIGEMGRPNIRLGRSGPRRLVALTGDDVIAFGVGCPEPERGSVIEIIQRGLLEGTSDWR